MSTTDKHIRMKALLISLLISILIFTCFWYTINHYEITLKQQQQFSQEKELTSKASTLTQIINYRFALLAGARAFVFSNFDQFNNQGHHSDPAAVNLFLKKLYSSIPDIRNITISPGGIHQYVYPDTEKTKMLGHNLLTDKRPHIRKKVQQTIESKQIGLSGPYPLRQDGSLGLIARLPIYHNEEFWGFITMVLNVTKMLEVGGLIPSDRFALRIAGGDIFYGNAAVFNESKLFKPIFLPEGQWEIALPLDTPGLSTSIKATLFIFSGIFTLLFSLLFFLFSTRRWHLQLKVDEATGQLNKRNEQLRYEITERKRADKELHIERDKLENIFEAMADGIYIVNQQYDIQYVNSVLIKEFGIYEGRKCYEYFHDLIEVCPWCKNRDVLAGKTVRWEWYSSKNHKTYDLIDTPLKNADGSISKLEIFRDITERKQTEKELKQHRDHLEEMVDERTTELRKMVNAMASREVWMAELKKEIKSLQEQLKDAGLQPIPLEKE